MPYADPQRQKQFLADWYQRNKARCLEKQAQRRRKAGYRDGEYQRRRADQRPRCLLCDGPIDGTARFLRSLPVCERPHCVRIDNWWRTTGDRAPRRARLPRDPKYRGLFLTAEYLRWLVHWRSSTSAARTG